MSAALSKEARHYLKSRGIVDDHVIEAARLSFDGERIVFPWLDRDGNEIYKTGRAINGAQPKYRHTAGERPPLYASPGAWEAERVALVEGHLDALACAQAGTAAFATAGSSVSAEVLSDRTEVVLVPDQDEAGERWLEKAIAALEGGRVALSVASMNGHGDAAAVGDPEALAEILAQATPVEPEWKTSWSPDESDGDTEPPARLSRADGEHLLYPGKLHWFAGEPESGKTFAALLACAEALQRGEAVVFVDFEDSGPGVRGRLRAMGADTERFVYVRPAEPLNDDARADIERLMAMSPAVVVLDGVSEAMALHGLDPIRAMDAATFVHEVLDRFRAPNVSTVVIDHVARGDAGKGRYAYGSQHKLAAVDGASYRFEIVQPFSRDDGGAARIDVMKDRPGFVRSFAMDKSRVGMLRVLPEGERLKVAIEEPDIPAEDEHGLSFTQRRVYDALGDEAQPMTYSQIQDLVAKDGRGKPLKRTTVQKALDELTELELADGVRTGGREANQFWKVAPRSTATFGQL